MKNRYDLIEKIESCLEHLEINRTTNCQYIFPTEDNDAPFIIHIWVEPLVIPGEPEDFELRIQLSGNHNNWLVGKTVYLISLDSNYITANTFTSSIFYKTIVLLFPEPILSYRLTFVKPPEY